MNNWSDDIERILGDIRQNCIVYSEAHKRNYFTLKGYLKYFKIPVIILAGFNSVFSVGLQPYVEQGTISVLTCLISLFAGIITSVELYLHIQSDMENEFITSKEFNLLAIDIYKILNLDRENRGISGKMYLDDKYSVYLKLVETSNLIDKKISDSINKIDVKKTIISQTDNSSVESVSTNNSVFV